jgi:hydrogenase maturation protein HypF
MRVPLQSGHGREDMNLVSSSRTILESVSLKLRQCNKNVFYPKHYPMNDGGLALGQAVIAAALGIH